ncbi:hypothetical protein PoB_002260800 [Plakobranchus ocellatus]|uniref:Uncharacterized protein n=1 Tax=Plakobranchus ocellatus TaxID=259542 RepID=A0AAV3ZND2_9GAST|nr:hypothetical protein PoB_002260800 [Plakobranchus ocellatus]
MALLATTRRLALQLTLKGKKREIPNGFIDLLDGGNEGHGGVDDDHQIHINTNDGDDGLLDDPHTNSDTNDEGVRVGCNVANGLLNNDFYES